MCALLLCSLTKEPLKEQDRPESRERRRRRRPPTATSPPDGNGTGGSPFIPSQTSLTQPLGRKEEEEEDGEGEAGAATAENFAVPGARLEGRCPLRRVRPPHGLCQIRIAL